MHTTEKIKHPRPGQARYDTAMKHHAPLLTAPPYPNVARGCGGREGPYCSASMSPSSYQQGEIARCDVAVVALLAVVYCPFAFWGIKPCVGVCSKCINKRRPHVNDAKMFGNMKKVTGHAP